MESFSLLKYWKSNGGGSGSGSGGGVNSKLSATTPTTVLTSVSHFESDGDGDGDVDDDGPFFDLEFPVSIADREHQDEDERQKVESEFAPLAEMEEIINSATGDKSSQLTLPISLMKSATKLRILMLAGLKRSKSETKQLPIENCQDSKTQNNNNNSKFTRVRLKMEDMKMPKMSILTRTPSNVVNNSSDVDEKLVSDISSSCDNKKERYLRLVRPLYVKVPRNKTNCEVEDDTVEVAEVKSCKTKLSLKVMAKKHLGKSKSSVVHSMPRSNGNNSRTNSNSNSNKSTLLSNKIDDSLLQQQDGIQSAILHCKRSFNSSSSSEDGEDTMSILLRSASDPSYEKKFTLEAAEVEEEDE